ncbi:hypothetical protein, partial [Klebsiella variicola]|uniref:hypothetical protein n=1 Tax=Klebsiella variicola TaxID=244366 RepID=UPI0023B091F8
FLQFTENAPIAFDSITKEDFLSTTQLLKLEDKILELFDLRSKSHGGQYSFGFGISQENFEMAKSGPSSISQVGMTMLKDAGGI